MENNNWPALTIQGIFLAANISFLLSGKSNGYIIASLTLLMFVFMIQSISTNKRFWFLFPINLDTGICTPSWDTIILKSLLSISVALFFLGATKSYVLTFIILAIGIGFPYIWDKYIDERNRENIKKIKLRN